MVLTAHERNENVTERPSQVEPLDESKNLFKFRDGKWMINENRWNHVYNNGRHLNVVVKKQVV